MQPRKRWFIIRKEEEIARCGDPHRKCQQLGRLRQEDYCKHENSLDCLRERESRRGVEIEGGERRKRKGRGEICVSVCMVVQEAHLCLIPVCISVGTRARSIPTSLTFSHIYLDFRNSNRRSDHFRSKDVR